jgi:hypothetical protein
MGLPKASSPLKVNTTWEGSMVAFPAAFCLREK